MAQIPTYEPTVGIQSPPTVRMDPRSISADANGQGVYQGIGRAAAGVQEYQDKQDKFDVTNAYTDAQGKLQSALYGDGGLFTLQGNNAIYKKGTNGQQDQLGVSQRVTDTLNSIQNDAMKSLSSPRQQQMFQRSWQSQMQSYQKAGMEYENKQKNVVFEDNYQANTAMLGRFFNDNIVNGQKAPADQNLQDIKSSEILYGQHFGLPSSVVNDNIYKKTNSAVSNAIASMMESGNWNEAKKSLDLYGDKYLSQGQKEIYSSKIKNGLDQFGTYTFVEGLKNDPTMVNPDGTLNANAMIDAAKNKYLTQTRKVVHPGTPGNGDYESFKKSLLVQESGNYDEPANGFGASGAYQMLESTWQSGLKVLGLPSDTPKTAENQDKVADALLKPLYDQYGARGAAIAWYAGDQNAPRVLSGLNPIGDNGNEYSADAKQDDGNGNKTAPSVNEYADSVLSRMGTAGTPTTTEDVPAPDMVGYKLALSQINQAVAEANAQHKQNVNNSMYYYDQWLEQEHPTTVSQLEAKAKELGLQGPDLLSAVAKGKQYAGLLKVEENEATAKTFEDALGKIYRGEITTQGELDTQYGGSLPYSKLIMLGNSLKKETKWATQENMLAFNGVLKDKGIKSGEEKSRIFDKINQSVADSLAKGIPITSEDIRSWTEEQTQKVILGRKWYGGSIKTDLGNVPAGWNVTSDGVFTPEGIQVTDYRDGKFYTTVNGVEIEVQP